MANKGKSKRRAKPNQRKPKPPNAISGFVFPREVVSLILSFLPVKSLLRFRSICKPWRSLISNLNFISTNLTQTISTSASSGNTSTYLIHTITQPNSDHSISLTKLSSASNPVTTSLEHPFPSLFAEMDVVGSASGVVCLSRPPWGQYIVLWNPATKRFTNVIPSRTRPFTKLNYRVSLGFGFDAETLDCKVISIFCFPPELGISDRVEVYSSNNQCWKRLEVKPQFEIFLTRCSVVVKGFPYWRAMVEDASGPREVLVCFDVKKEGFRQFPMPVVSIGSCNCVVDLRDSVGMVVWEEERVGGGCVDVWEMDEDDGWSKKFSVGLEFVEKAVWCSKKGHVLVDGGGELLLYEVDGEEMKRWSLARTESGSFEVFNYVESLVQIREGGACVQYQQEAEAARRRLLWCTLVIHIPLDMGFDIKFRSDPLDIQLYPAV